MLTSQWQKAARGRRWYVILMCAGAWLFLFLGPLSVGIWLIIISALVAAIRWRSWQPALILLLSPLTVGFLFGSAAWFRHQPEFVGMGLPSSESFSLDPVTRCYWSIGGCKVYGSEWILLDSHNLGLTAMTTIFGPPRGTYHGPYPTKEEALQATRGIEATPLATFHEGTVLAGTTKYHLGTKFVEQFLLDFNVWNEEDESRQVQAAIYRKRCLVLRISTKNERAIDKSSNEPEGIALVDLETMKPFALYVVSGYVDRFPRILRR